MWRDPKKKHLLLFPWAVLNRCFFLSHHHRLCVSLLCLSVTISPQSLTNHM